MNHFRFELTDRLNRIIAWGSPWITRLFLDNGVNYDVESWGSLETVNHSIFSTCLVSTNSKVKKKGKYFSTPADGCQELLRKPSTPARSSIIHFSFGFLFALPTLIFVFLKISFFKRVFIDSEKIPLLSILFFCLMGEKTDGKTHTSPRGIYFYANANISRLRRS